METTQNNNKIVIESLIAVNILFSVMWAYTAFFGYERSSSIITIPGNMFICLAVLLASVVAFEQSKEWGGKASTLGKSFFYFGLGLLFYGAGFFVRMIYIYVAGIGIPFPSSSDIFRMAYYPLVIFGLVVLIIELKVGLSAKDSMILFFMPLFLLAVFFIFFSNYSLLQSSNSVKSAFAIFYPVADIILVALCFILLIICYKGKYEKAFLFIATGLIIQVIGDIGFALTNLKNTYYPGSWVDLVLTFGVTIIAIGICAASPSEDMLAKKNIKTDAG